MAAYCALRTTTGHFVTAVNGGGMGNPGPVDVPINTDRTEPGPWEKFKLVSLDGGYIAIQTYTGHYLSAVNGGGMGNPGRRDHPVNTDRPAIGPWEKFMLVPLDGGWYAFKTDTGHYLTAVNGGGMGEAENKLPLHTDAKAIGPWEKFILVPVRKPKS